MQTKPTPDSVAAAAGLGILNSIWMHVINDRAAEALIHEISKELIHKADPVSLAIVRMTSHWRIMDDFDEWRMDLHETFAYAADVCLAGNPAINGICGDPHCVCDEVN